MSTQPDPQSIKSPITPGLYERREQIEAFQFTEALAESCLFDKHELPWGLSVGGSYHPDRREVYSASVWVPQPSWSTRLGSHARYGDWVCRIAGELFAVDGESFAAKYRAISKAESR